MIEEKDKTQTAAPPRRRTAAPENRGWFKPTHGDAATRRRSREYRIWSGMIQRCETAGSANYEKYGARGIKVCEAWKQYEMFRTDMGRCPSPVHTLDRIDGAKGYEPGNCRWATQKEQQNNRRNNHRIEVDGVSHTIAEWSELSGILWWTISARLLRGWTPKQAVSAPVKEMRKWASTMTPEQRSDIVQRFRSGESIRHIAKEQGTYDSSVKRLLEKEMAHGHS